MQLKRVIFWSCKTVIATLFSFLLLSLFTVIYNNTGIHIANPSGATDYFWKPNQLKTTMCEGFSELRMDENGCNNVDSQDENIDILLMGSSHMEAVQVSKYENTGYLLNHALKDKRVYNIGMSGHTIYHCANNIEDAIKVYSPKGFAIIETATVELDIQSMKMVLDSTYPHIDSYDKGLVYLVQKNIPAAKVLYKQIGRWRAAENNEPAAPKKEKIDASDHNYLEILEKFLSKAAAPVQQKGAKLFIFYQPDTKVDSFGNLLTPTDPMALAAFEAACEKNGIIFVDMTDSFQELYDTEYTLAHGFPNTAVGEGHLNAAGHRAIAEKLIAVIQKEYERQEGNPDVSE